MEIKLNNSKKLCFVFIIDCDIYDEVYHKLKELTIISSFRQYLRNDYGDVPSYIKCGESELLEALRVLASLQIDTCIVQSVGHIIYDKTFYDEVFSSDVPLVCGHIINNDTISLHKQFIIINLKSYNAADVDTTVIDISFKPSHETINSTYTPQYIRHSPAVTKPLGMNGHLLAYAVAKVGVVHNVPRTLRGKKFYVYPESSESHEAIKKLITKDINIKLSSPNTYAKSLNDKIDLFIGDEQRTKHDVYFVTNRSRERSQDFSVLGDKDISLVLTPCAGDLSAAIIASVPSITDVVHYDLSLHSISNTKAIIEDSHQHLTGKMVNLLGDVGSMRQLSLVNNTFVNTDIIDSDEIISYITTNCLFHASNIFCYHYNLGYYDSNKIVSSFLNLINTLREADSYFCGYDPAFRYIPPTKASNVFIDLL